MNYSDLKVLVKAIVFAPFTQTEMLVDLTKTAALNRIDKKKIFHILYTAPSGFLSYYGIELKQWPNGRRYIVYNRTRIVKMKTLRQSNFRFP